MQKLPTPPSGAQEHFTRGLGIQAEDSDPLKIRAKPSAFSLTIKKANGLFPCAHAILGLTRTQLDDGSKTSRELYTVLQQMKRHAQARIFFLGSDGAKRAVHFAVRMCHVISTST